MYGRCVLSLIRVGLERRTQNLRRRSRSVRLRFRADEHQHTEPAALIFRQRHTKKPVSTGSHRTCEKHGAEAARSKLYSPLVALWGQAQLWENSDTKRIALTGAFGHALNPDGTYFFGLSFLIATTRLTGVAGFAAGVSGLVAVGRPAAVDPVVPVLGAVDVEGAELAGGV